MSKKKEATLKSARIHCPKLGKVVTLPAGSLSWSAADDECDMCGSHGHVTMTVTCECGKYHDIELSSW